MISTSIRKADTTIKIAAATGLLTSWHPKHFRLLCLEPGHRYDVSFTSIVIAKQMAALAPVLIRAADPKELIY